MTLPLVRRSSSGVLTCVLALGLACSPGLAKADEGAPEAGAPPPPARASAPAPAGEYPSTIDEWPEGTPAPAGYHWERKARLGAIIAGACVLGVTWILTSTVGALGYDLSTPKDSDYLWLYVPVAGPFVELLNNAPTATAKVFLVTDGLAQAAGAALLIYGVTSPVSRVVRNDASHLQITPVPTVSRNGAGLSVVGTF